VDDEHRTFGFKRQYGDDLVFVFINAGEDNLTLDYVDGTALNKHFHDVFTNQSYVFENGTLSLDLEQESVLILSSNLY